MNFIYHENKGSEVLGVPIVRLEVRAGQQFCGRYKLQDVIFL